MKLLLLLTMVCISPLIYTQEVFYTYNDIPLQEIQSNKTEWTAYNNPIYEGLENGVYWFKIELTTNTPKILNIPESHISNAVLYYNNIEIKRKENTRYVTFNLNPKTNKSIYYLKVNCLLEARIPLEIKEIDAYYKSESKQFIISGMYLGLVLCIIIFNLLSYLSFKDNTYIYYIFMVIGMAMNAVYKDGITALIFGLEGINERLETSLTGILVISAIFFSTKFLSLNKYLPKLKNLGIIIVIVSLLFNIIYIISGNFKLFILTDILYLIALDIFWFTSLLLWNKSKYAKFFCIAYGIPLLFAHDYYISPHIGVKVLNLPLIFYKVGSMFEMIVFTYAILSKSKDIEKENKEMHKKIINYTYELKNIEISDENHTSTDELIKLYSFTIREIEILKKVASEKTNKEIANELFISENTVKYHIRNILQKLEVKNRKEASDKYLNFPKNNTNT